MRELWICESWFRAFLEILLDDGYWLQKQSIDSVTLFARLFNKTVSWNRICNETGSGADKYDTIYLRDA
jgi:hypothetical protein